MNISHFTTPDTQVKTVLLYYPGKFPKKTKPAKDVTLPTRLWPGAKYIIWTNLEKGIGKNNIEYFSELFKGHNFELVSEKVDADVLFIHHENYNIFGGVVGKGLIDRANLIKEWTSKVTLFYNDELFVTFSDLRDFIDMRCSNPNFLLKNPNLLEQVSKNSDWTKVTLLMNENKVTDWANNYLAENLKDQIKVSYLSDIILYDLKTDEIKAKTSYNKKGVYVPLFTGERISVCNKLFSGNIDLTFAGSRSDDLKDNIKGDGKYITNVELPMFLHQYDWTIYIGKGRASQYLGATFYEPLLKGLPVFVWLETDKNKKIFGDLDCYFSTETELQSLIEKWDMKTLFEEQVKLVF